MNLLVVCGAYPLASETFVRAQCVGLAELGHRVEILGLSRGNRGFDAVEVGLGLDRTLRRVEIAASPLRRWPKLPFASLPAVLRQPRRAAATLNPRLGWRAAAGQLLEAAVALRRGGAWPRQFDAIHCQFGPSGRFAVLLRRAGIVAGPISTAFYGYDITREPRLRGGGLYRELFEEAAVLLPNSEHLAARLRDAGAPPGKIEVHRLGIDPADFPLVDRSGRDPAAPWRVLAVGRLVEKKGFGDLLQAIARLRDAEPLLRATIVGDGPLRGDLEAMARTLGIAERVRFAGWLAPAEVAAAMAEADLLAVPSVTAADGDMEGMPLVVLEAMATGLPVVGTRHSGIPEVVLDGITGRIVPERDPAALAGAIASLADPSRRREQGEAGHRRAVAEFDNRRLVAALAARLARCGHPPDPAAEPPREG